MLGITGGTGGLGSSIINRIIDKSLLPTSEIVVFTRNPSSDAAKAYTSKGASARKADFSEPSFLPQAFKGIDTLLIMPPGPSAGPHGTKYQVDAIDAAKSAGVKKIYLISNVATKDDTDWIPAVIHYDVEQHLEKEGWDFVSIRNAFYISSINLFLPDVVNTGVIAAPPDGKVNWIEREELGQAAAHIVTGAHPVKGKYIDLVPPQAHNFADTARILSKITGKTITRKEISEEEFHKGFLGKGFPEEAAAILGTVPGRAIKGDWEETGSIVEDLIGRKCKTLEEYLTEQYGQKA